MRENQFMRIAETKPRPYNIRTCLQQLHDLSRVLHNNHIIIINLKQKFLFAFSINMKKVRDLIIMMMMMMDDFDVYNDVDDIVKPSP